MECDKKKNIVSLVFLVVAVLVYFLTEWTIWISMLALVSAFISFFCKCKCRTCYSQEEKLVTENSIGVTSEVEAESAEELEKSEEENLEKVSAESFVEDLNQSQGGEDKREIKGSLVEEVAEDAEKEVI